MFSYDFDLYIYIVLLCLINIVKNQAGIAAFKMEKTGALAVYNYTGIIYAVLLDDFLFHITITTG